MTDTATAIFVAALGFAWTALALALLLRKSGLPQSLPRAWRGRSALARTATIAAVVVATVYGGSKPSGTNGTGGAATLSIPRPSVVMNGMPAGGDLSVGGDATNALRFTAFSFDGDDQFDFSIAWPATNLAEYAAIDVFHKRELSDPAWRWIGQGSVWPGDGETQFSFYGGDLPYWEEVVSRSFRVDTNAVESPFGVVFTNIYARVPEPTDAAPRSSFFMLADQSDADGDGLSDAVERSLGYDPLDPDMDGDGVPDGRELTLGSSPLLTDSDGDGLDDGFEVSWGAALTNGAALWLDISAATNRTVIFTDADDDCAQIPMPLPLHLCGAAMTNLTVNANGLVGFSAGGAAFGDGWHSNGYASSSPLADATSATVAAFWDDLRVRPDMDSEVVLSVCGEAPGQIAVIEFSCVGFYSGGTNDFVSFQVQFREDETNMVHVVFSETSGRGTGASATLGARSSNDDGVEYSRDEADAVFPGLHLEYHFGIGSSPALADTDGDGLTDGEEAALGTNPNDADTDGDGMPDVWETGYEFDPLNAEDPGASADADGDGLSNLEEFECGTNPLQRDTDGDGLADNVEVGYVSASAQATFDMTGATNVIGRFDDLDDGLTSIPLPFPIQPRSAEICSNIVLGINGGLALATDEDDWLPSSPRESRPLIVSAFEDDLMAYTNELGTALSVATFGTNGVRRFVIEYRSFGFYGSEVSETNSVSFQVSFAEEEPDTVRVCYYSANPLRDNLSERALGANAKLEALTASRSLVYSHFSPMAQPGLTLDYHLGTGTSPLLADTDGDGLGDAVELALGTNPVLMDTDGDGLGDAAELALGTNPVLADTDGDGLDDGDEENAGTNPLSEDTDGDGLPDGWESIHGLNPLDAAGSDADDDADGLDNLCEYQLGTNPSQPDTDGDGMDDGWEYANGFDPATDNAQTTREDDDYAADPDGDGLPNGDECAYGANPFAADTDGDGVGDAAEVAQGSDPADGSDGGNAANVIRVQFEFGDNSGSESEKYRLQIRPVAGEGATPKTLSFLNQRFDGTDTYVVPLKPGWKYEVRLRHAATDPGHSGEPDYDYRLWMTPQEAPTRVILDDPDGLFGRSKSNQAATFTTSPKAAHVYALNNPTMAADYDRDGDIDAADEALAASGRVLRFWINDDEDRLAANGNYSGSPRTDVPGAESTLWDLDQRTPDFNDSAVNGRCDLVDFTPVFLDTHCLASLPADIRNNLVFRLRQDDGAVNAVWSAIGKNDVGSFQTSDAAVCGSALNSPPRAASVASVSASGTQVSAAFANLLHSTSTLGGVAFIEGRAATTAPLYLDISYDGKTVASASLPLALSSVEEMFWSYSLRGAESNAGFPLPAHYTPGNMAEVNGAKTVFFLHGFRVPEEAARGWGAEMFKRLWQSGSNARFVAVTWAGDYNWMGNWASGFHYHENAFNALKTADALKALVEREQPMAANRVVMAHSLGNMVVCEALRKGLSVGKYFMFDAAVPSEAIDGTLQGAAPEDEPYDKYVPGDWHGYTNLCWASNWHRLFAGDPADSRCKMGWPDFFADAFDNAATVYNYYSSGDPVFMEAESVPEVVDGVFHWPTLGWNWPPVSLNVTFETYSWQKQETRKGVDFAFGTLDGGWGFRVWDAAPPNEGVMLTNYSASAAAELVASGAITNSPVFEISGTSLDNPNATENEIREALAKHVPAVSSAVGHLNVLDGDIDNYDMNSPSCRNGWGRSIGPFPNSWLHSDIKDMAYFYVFPLFETIITNGGFQ